MKEPSAGCQTIVLSRVHACREDQAPVNSARSHAFGEAGKAAVVALDDYRRIPGESRRGVLRLGPGPQTCARGLLSEHPTAGCGVRGVGYGWCVAKWLSCSQWNVTRVERHSDGGRPGPKETCWFLSQPFGDSAPHILRKEILRG